MQRSLGFILQKTRVTEMFCLGELDVHVDTLVWLQTKQLDIQLLDLPMGLDDLVWVLATAVG